MIEDKLSKLNETVPEASKSINKRNEIYQSVINDKTKFKSFFNYKKMLLVSISCIFVIVLSISIINNYKTKKYHLSLDYFFENNEYCERINYESWMEENIIKENVGQGDIAPPSKTMHAIFGDGIYDVSYSDDKGFYFVVYLDTNHVERILSMSGCTGHEININEIVRITNGIRVNYKELNENLLYVKCNDKYKIPAFIESYYPVQIFYMHEITVKEELLSSTKLDKNMFFSTTLCFEKNESSYLVPAPIPEDALSVEDTLPGKNAIVISNDLETIKNSTIMNTLYYYSPQLFYNDYIVFYEYGFTNYEWFFYDWFLDGEDPPRTHLSNEMLSLLTKTKRNKGSLSIEDFEYFDLINANRGEVYYTVNNYNNINEYTYIETNNYKNMLRLIGKSKTIDFTYKKIINNMEYCDEMFAYSYKIISSYEEFLQAANALGFNSLEYDSEFFKTKSICFIHNCINAKIVRKESILYIEGYYIPNEVPPSNIYFTLEFDKIDIDNSDWIIYFRTPIGKND